MASGELVALLGRNGAGKTTTVKAIMGMVTVRDGQIRCGGRDVVGMAPESIAQFGIGYVPEDRRMFPGLTRPRELPARGVGFAGCRNPSSRRHSAARWRSSRCWRSTSTGMRPGCPGVSSRWWPSAGRSSAGRKLLLVDEVTQGLAPNIATDMGRTLRRVADEGLGVLLVEQNASSRWSSPTGSTCSTRAWSSRSVRRQRCVTTRSGWRSTCSSRP